MIRWTVDGRALQAPRTGIGHFLAGLLPPLSEKVPLALGLPRMSQDLPSFRGEILCGPALPGSIWFHRWFDRLRDQDTLFCPLGVRPYASAKKSVVVLHDLSVLRYPGWQSLKNRVTVLPFLEDTVRHARLIVPSRRVYDEVLRYFRGAHVSVIPHGWDPPSEAASWDRAPLPDEYFLFLGTLEPRKNPRLLVDLWKEHPELPPLLMAGAEGWHVRLGRMPGSIRLLGYVTAGEKRWLLEHALSLLYPSSYEGFGLPVAEAGSLGVPVIATRVPAVEEYDIPSWVSITLTKASLLDAVRQVLHGKAPRLRAALPSWEEAACRYAQVMKKYADPD
jgi:alpha-1,3-rhamnosyl/mannosyltransferase